MHDDYTKKEKRLLQAVGWNRVGKAAACRDRDFGFLFATQGRELAGFPGNLIFSVESLRCSA